MREIRCVNLEKGKILNLNEAIVATAKKQKECRLAFLKYLFLGILFIIILPVGGGFAVGYLFQNRLAPLFFIIIYIPFFQAALMANRGRVTSELGDYKGFIKRFSSAPLFGAQIQILATIRMPASVVKNFAKSASIRQVSFAPKIKSAAFITASNLTSAKRSASQTARRWKSATRRR